MLLQVFNVIYCVIVESALLFSVLFLYSCVRDAYSRSHMILYSVLLCAFVATMLLVGYGGVLIAHNLPA